MAHTTHMPIKGGTNELTVKLGTDALLKLSGPELRNASITTLKSFYGYDWYKWNQSAFGLYMESDPIFTRRVSNPRQYYYTILNGDPYVASGAIFMPYLQSGQKYLFDDSIIHGYIGSRWWCNKDPKVLSLGVRWINTGIPSGLSSYFGGRKHHGGVTSIFMLQPARDLFQELKNKIQDLVTKEGYDHLNIEELRAAVKDLFGAEVKFFKMYNTDDYYHRFLTQTYIDFFRFLRKKPNLDAKQRQKLAETYLISYDYVLSGILKDMDASTINDYLKDKLKDLTDLERAIMEDQFKTGTVAKDGNKYLDKVRTGFDKLLDDRTTATTNYAKKQEDALFGNLYTK